MKADADRNKHWLYRRQNQRRLWWLFAVILGATVIAQLTIHVHGHFGFDEGFGFHAYYGFIACAVMVVFAKVLGFILKRPEDYYNDDV